LLSGQPRQAAALNLVGELGYFLAVGNLASRGVSQRGFGFIDAGQNFQAATLALFPQQHRFPHGIFFAAKTAGFQRFPDESSLVLGEMHFHGFSLSIAANGVNGIARNLDVTKMNRMSSSGP
jgi:hypothetical protein